MRNLNTPNQGLIKSSTTLPIINCIYFFVLARAVDEVTRVQVIGEEVRELSHSFFFFRKFRKEKLTSRKRPLELEYDSTTYQGK